MPRSGRESRVRLQSAALELIAERGFEAVTTAEIAERAGVTERTFFRHFGDKREVLFEGENLLADWVATAFAAVPQDISAAQTMHRVIADIVPLLEQNRPNADRLEAITAETPALAERAASKEARLIELIADLLSERGEPEFEAQLIARASWSVLVVAMRAWRKAQCRTDLQTQVSRAFAALDRLTSG